MCWFYLPPPQQSLWRDHVDAGQWIVVLGSVAKVELLIRCERLYIVGQQGIKAAKRRKDEGLIPVTKFSYSPHILIPAQGKSSIRTRGPIQERMHSFVAVKNNNRPPLVFFPTCPTAPLLPLCIQTLYICPNKPLPTRFPLEFMAIRW